MRRVMANSVEPVMESLDELAQEDAFAAYRTARSLIHRAGM